MSAGTDNPSNSSSLRDKAHNTRFAARWRWRMIKDFLMRYAVAVGGVGVIIAIVLIFFYLLFVVLPLFQSADAEAVASYELPGGGGATLHLALEEQAQLAVRYSQEGRAVFFGSNDGRPVTTENLPIPEGVSVSSFAQGLPGSGIVGYGLSNGAVLMVRHVFRTSFVDGERILSPVIEFPLGETPVAVEPRGQPIIHLALRSDDDQVTFVAAAEDGQLLMYAMSREESLLDESGTWTHQVSVLPPPQAQITHILIDPSQRTLYVASEDGHLSYYDLSDKNAPLLVQRLRVVDEGERIGAIRFLAGGISLIVGDSRGRLSQWFPVRDERNNNLLTRIRDFDEQNASISAISPEKGRKGFIAADVSGKIGIYHATSHRTLLLAPATQAPINQLAVSPRADAMLIEDNDGKMHFWRVHNEHPEVSWKALWGKVWYENYSKPDYVWQSSSANDDFEPKFSLVPISFGTLKAAFYALIVAAPLAILGAIYTGHFMAPRMRKQVKPGIEVMGALPTVILGFLAGLWLAPFVEHHLPGFISMLFIVPLGVMIMAFVWFQLPERWRNTIPEGWEAGLLIPVVILLLWFSIKISPTLEQWWFGGDMRQWLTNEVGIAFDQRNSIIVGIAMGFAVIPLIFSIAEDAIFSVPKQLVEGSLALGATPWQTLWRVVLLTASPGIFSALMIGFGRAVGETMIVLMATGNTPVLDFSIFQGMRTLSANIAVEMPESEVNSTHYRVLFLAALVLFLFTFLFNTLAESMRQRLRRKYGSL